MISAPAASTPRANRLSGLFEPATVVLFAGLGGVCIGVEQAYVEGGYRDKYIDLAVNHWDTAVAVHELNHPMTQHLHCDVWEVDPNAVLPGRKIAYLHASPDCADFSKAKGGAPKRKHIRALADVVLVWAGKRRPDVITLENVEEFKQWGPLLPHGQPDPKKRGTEYRRWKSELEALGYIVEDRELRACDYGTPTTRKRLFVVARCDGKPIIWPEATHGSVGIVRGAIRSFDSSGWTRMQRGVVGAGDCAGSGRCSHRRANRTSRLEPYRTAASCIDWRQPMLSIFATRADARDWSKAQNVGRLKQDRLGIPQRPLKPKTQKRIAGGLLKWVLNAREPFIINIANYGWDSSPSEPVTQPLSTVTAGPRGGKHAAVDVELAAYTGTFNHGGEEHRTADVREPLATVTGARDARGVVGVEFSSFTVPRHGERDVYLAPFYGEGSGKTGHTPANPLPTVPSKDRFGLVSLDATPHWLFTPAGLRRARQVATWARRQLGSKVDDHLLWVADPESGKRFPLLCLALAGAVHIVTDIAMRMLRPRELARAQGFPDDYVIDRTSDGRPVSKADQVKLIGNSVPPQLAKAIAAANVVRLGVLDGAREAVSA